MTPSDEHLPPAADEHLPAAADERSAVPTDERSAAVADEHPAAPADQSAWTALGGLPDELVQLAQRCVRADGGMPLATEPWFLRRRWAAPEGQAFGLLASGPLAAGAAPAGGEAPAGGAAPAGGRVLAPGGRPTASAMPASGGAALVAAGAVCPVGDGVVVTGLVDPAARGLGLGARVLDRGLALAAASGREVTVETESLTVGAAELFASRGFRQVFAEDVMRIGLGRPVPATWAGDVTLTTWSPETAGRFFAVYTAAFRERPGFPGESLSEWVGEYDTDDEFRPGWSVLVSLPGLGDVGFVTAAVGWIVQVGVVPHGRGRGIGGALVRESLARMAADGGTEAWLNVNVNNPGAAGLYRRLGFAFAGRRARFRREAS